MQPNPPEPPPQPSEGLHGNAPEDLLARALESGSASGAWTPPDPEHLSRLLPEYPIECLIGRGGMGAVYKGRQRRLNRVVAVKVLPAELAEDNEFIGRFHREAHLLASLNHPGIVTIFDFGQTAEGHLYFVMEHLEGTDLHRLIHQTKLEAGQALNLTIQICEAMQYAHDRGVIHRDIKPANVLVTPDWRVKLADFGLALKPAEHRVDMPRPPQPDVFDPADPLGVMALRFTRPGAAMGTADYAAPEVYEGRADERSDIYAVGIMLYEMLVGEPPRGYFALPSTKAKVDERVDKVVIKALEIEPSDRYQRASDMKVEVERATVPPPGDQPPSQRPVEEVQLEIIRPGAGLPGRYHALSAGYEQPRSKGAMVELVIIAVLVVGGAFAWYAQGHWTLVKGLLSSLGGTPGAKASLATASEKAGTRAAGQSQTATASLQAPKAERPHSLREALVSYDWNLYCPDGESWGHWTKGRFHADGTATITTSRNSEGVWSWKTLGPRALRMEHPVRGSKYVNDFNFDETFSAFSTAGDWPGAGGWRTDNPVPAGPTVFSATK